ncbi:MAG TPA: excinuclease ABC subunit UvrA [Candidatus Pacearchaeota archaeon]|nr:excinuclease ABC subunit UvrA [Candidatus Pacearchaeota archaeon]
MDSDFIELSGVRVHNLKNISVKIPKNKLAVVCGISGSGKSSLAFDTIFQEGQRRYLESLSSYARQFLGGLKKPDVDKISGLSPTIAVNQKTISSNPRSTVGTLTEIYDYLRLLFAHIGVAHCPKCGRPVSAQTPDHIAEKIYQTALKKEVSVVAPAVAAKKGAHAGVLEEIYRSGWPKVIIDGITYDAAEAKDKVLDRNKAHTIGVAVDVFDLRQFNEKPKNEKKQISKSEREALAAKKKRQENFMKEEKERILAAVKKGLEIGKGKIIADRPFSTRFSCPDCDISLPDIEPKIFSFNSPYGACKTCQGLGKIAKINESLILNPRLSLNQGAILPWFSLGRWSLRTMGVPHQKWSLQNLAAAKSFSLDEPFGNLPEHIQTLVLYGDKSDPSYEGIISRMERAYRETTSEYLRGEITKYMSEIECSACGGARLSPEALSVKIAGSNIADVCRLPAKDAIVFLENLKTELPEKQKEIARPLLAEICKRLSFLAEVGVDYINLGREATTLSVGENQRIRLACQLGSALSGVVYVLDEPTVGLHQRDVDRLIGALKKLKDLKNTVIVVEHDEQVIQAADWVIEIGPAAGKHGGKLVFEGTPKQLLRAKTLTGKYLSGRMSISAGFKKREVSERTLWLELAGAKQFTLKGTDLKIPLGKLTAVCGVSGSGKSTLVIETLAAALLRDLMRARTVPGKYESLAGTERINKAVLVDQSPIGKTPRSNPATYTGVFNYIRELYTRTRDSQIRGFTPGHFSFNTQKGRCPVCAGEGWQKVEMYFLPDIYVECEACQGKRFTAEVLSAKYRDKSIADVLEMSVDEAKNFFADIPPINDKMQTLSDIGLGYLQLGQSAPSLSGGEAQRVKLATELAKRDTGRTIYILDEPTVGLHFDDAKKLLIILRRLVEKGNTVIVIEHNLDFIKEADWCVEMGPDGGANGGQIIFTGPPEQLAKSNTWTAKFLK